MANKVTPTPDARRAQLARLVASAVKAGATVDPETARFAAGAMTDRAYRAYLYRQQDARDAAAGALVGRAAALPRAALRLEIEYLLWFLLETPAMV